ncbi:phosphoribosylamine--glycine ligase [bacterium]|nr:phosphoribosylamine--glycine ligase [bacterium]MDA7905889.1 phosphoribosylamine--glycine ligase [Mariniblastus sp.]MDA7887560.1 phosphoribosylamine--glycine ligase [bacterium]MDB4357200.1 phosphoribosylamine--glycine ligase [Mariniblastus sp.]MDB4368252.1 phosphoribosylamine--glycine ligase [Mariniblastus sp.]
MKVLVVGNGGREHAIAWKISQSPRADRVFVAPGNAGTAQDVENIEIAADNITELIAFAKQNEIGLTVVGPEIPLCNGIVDAFEDAGLKVFGPSRAAAQLEGSKVFCKNVLRAADVPTADFQEFHSAEPAERFINERYSETPDDCPVVIKADGLAAGKGAIVCSTRDEALEAIDIIARQKQFGDAGNKMIIEDRLQGIEASILAITDGQTILTLPPAEDHKRAHDGDTGPNTGGMGAYCPTPSIDDKTLRWVESNVLVQTVHVMKRKRNPFRGILYAGMMMTPQGPKVLEYNVRFGDPECQPLLLRLKTDFLDLIEATVDRRLGEIGPLQWDERPSVCVVMASDGYPGKYETGKVIRGLEDAAAIEDVKVFHAGTRLDENQNVVTSGGRVLGVTALGDSVATAKLQAYKAIKCIRWDGAWCRKDISDKAITLSR